MKQTNIQIRGQKSSQFLKKHFYCIPLPLGSKPHKIDHFELRMGQITHSFLAMVIGEIKFTTPLEKKKKVVASALLHFVNKLHTFRG